MQILPTAKTQFIDQNGLPLASGTVGFYVPGTLTPKPTYQDAAGTIANTNPVQLDSRGQALIWGSGVYRQIVKDASGVTIWDQITEDPNAGLTGNITDAKFVSGTDFTPGVTTQLTLPANPGAIQNMWVFFDAAYQADDQITSVVGTTLTFNAPIPVGVSEVNVKIGNTVAIGTPGAGTITDSMLAPGSRINALNNTEIPAMWFAGIDPTGAVDSTAGINAAFTFAASIGGEVVFPPGNFAISGAGIVLDQTHLTSEDDLRRVSVRGAGSGSTRFSYTGTGNAFTYKGNTAGGLAGFFSIRGISIVGGGFNVSGNGLSIISSAWMGLEDIVVKGFNNGIACIDVLSSNFVRVNSRFNSHGADLRQSSFSTPNAITMLACEWGANVNTGMFIADPSNVTMIGGAVEGNGIGGTETTRGGIWVDAGTGAALTGPVSASFFGVYFENNTNDSDILFQAGNVEGSTSISAYGCTFNRVSGTNFCNYNVHVSLGGITSAKTKVTVSGCGFRGFNNYTPSGTRPYIFIESAGAPYDFSDGGGSNMYDAAIERPAISGPAKTGAAMASSWVTFTCNPAAILQSYNVASVIRNGTGDYVITFQKPMQFGNYAVQYSIAGGFGLMQVSSPANGTLHVLTVNSSGTPTDFTALSVSTFGGGEIT